MQNEGLKYAAKSLCHQVERDLGLGSSEVRERIATLLKSWTSLAAKTYPSASQLDELEQWRQRSASGYLQRWRDALLTESDTDVEFAARVTAAAMLGMGFSQEWLLDATLEQPGESMEASLERAFTAAIDAVAAPKPKFEVVIPMTSTPTSFSRAARLLTLSELSTWVTENAVEMGDLFALGAQGGLLFEVEARDRWAAVREARRPLRSALARHVVSGPNSSPRDLGVAAVKGALATFPLRDGRRRVEVGNLTRGFRPHPSLEPGWDAAFDNAIELVSTMEEDNPAVAVSAGWAAVEGLLSRSGENGGGIEAADRMARIVCATWPRAELGTLASQWRREQGTTSGTLTQLTTDFEQRVRSGEHISFKNGRDQAGLARIRSVIDSPKDALGRVEGYLRDVFRRLYNQRNLVMHRGTHRSPGLEAVVQTAPPLVGAGLDRIANGLHRGASPLQLAERAGIELSLLGTAAQRPLADML